MLAKPVSVSFCLLVAHTTLLGLDVSILITLLTQSIAIGSINAQAEPVHIKLGLISNLSIRTTYGTHQND